MKYRYIVILTFLILLVFVVFMLMRQEPLQGGLPEAQELPLQSESSSAVANPQTQKNASPPPSVLVESVYSEEPVAPATEASNFDVNIGNESYSILFDGEDITQEFKRAIIDDLNINFSHYTAFGFREIHPNDLEECQLYQRHVSYWLDRRDGQRDFSADILRENFGGAVKMGDSYQLIINQKLIDAYEQVFQLKADHSAAFSNADDFIELLKDKKFIDEIGSGKQQTARSLFLFEDKRPSVDLQELAEFLDKTEIRKPSVLDFELATYEGKDVIRFITLIDYGLGTDSLLKGYPEFIYMDGKWRIHFPRLP